MAARKSRQKKMEKITLADQLKEELETQKIQLEAENGQLKAEKDRLETRNAYLQDRIHTWTHWKHIIFGTIPLWICKPSDLC